MGLGDRTGKRHETARTAGVVSSDYWDYQPGQTVMTCDGYLGTVQAVSDGPFAGSEEYQVVLHHEMGGGRYTASQLRPAAERTASHEVEATANTAALDYPELAEILRERPDPGKYPESTLGLVASLQTEAVVGPMDSEKGACIQCAAHGMLSCGETVGECHACGNPRTDIYTYRSGAYADNPENLCLDCLNSGHHMESAHNKEHADVETIEHLGRRPRGEGGFTPVWMKTSKQANVGEPPGMCENGHLTWGGDCASCRNADGDDNAMVVNPGDTKPQDVENIKNASVRVLAQGYSPETHHGECDFNEDGECENHAWETKRVSQPCEVCDSEHHTTEDHEDVPDEADDYIGQERNGSWYVYHGDQGHLPSQRCSAGPEAHEDLPDKETAAHVLMHCQHERGYFPNVWESSHGGDHELSQTYNKHVERWGPNIGSSVGQVHRGAEHLPEQPFPEDSDLEQHLIEHHGMTRGELRYADGTEQEPQDLRDTHAEHHEENNCPVEGEDCPWNRVGHHHRGYEQELHSDNFGPADRDPWRSTPSPAHVPDPGEGYDRDRDRQRLNQADQSRPSTPSSGGDSADMQFSHHDMPQAGESLDAWLSRTSPNTSSFSPCPTCKAKGTVRSKGPVPEGKNPWEHRENCPTCKGSGHMRPDGTPAQSNGFGKMASRQEAQDFYFQVTAAWRDVQSKAKRIRREGGVHITLAQRGYVVATVKGDTATYEAVLMKYPGTQKVGQWDCGCKWGQYHWGAPDDKSRFAGRMCSHALALNYEAQARGMFGREIAQDPGRASWLEQGEVPVSSMTRDRHPSQKGMGVVSSLDEMIWVHASQNDDRLPGDPVQPDDPNHQIVVPPMAGIAPYCSCGWPETEGGKRMVWRHGDKTLAQHLNEVGATPRTAAVSSPFGEPDPSLVSAQPGPTMQRIEGENPASAGFLTAADPESWTRQSPSALVNDRVAIKRGEDGWEDAGLGCPHCDDAFTTMQARSSHIQDEHPGEYQGPSQDLSDLFEIRPDLKHASLVDDALFEPEIAKEAIAPLIAPLVRTVAPMVLKHEVIKGLTPGGDQEGEQESEQAAPAPAQPSPYRSHAPGNPLEFAATLHDEPEPALPSTDGAADDDGDDDGGVLDALASQGPVSTGITYATPSDPGQSDPTRQNAPSPGLISVPDDALSPQSPSIQTVGGIEAIVEQFQRTAGASKIMAGSSTADGVDIAAAAREHLGKTAMAEFSPGQQREIIDEGKDVRAANLDRLSIEGTHYALLPDSEDDDEFWTA